MTKKENTNKDNNKSTDTTTFITTHQYRIKDSNKKLVRSLMILSSKVNFIWNYVNGVQKQVIDRNNAGYKHRFWLNKFDLHELTKGSAELINLPAQTIQAINEEYVTRRVHANKAYLKFRTNKGNRNLPWIPFKAQDIKIDNKNGVFTFCGLKLKTFYSQIIPNIKTNNKINNKTKNNNPLLDRVNNITNVENNNEGCVTITNGSIVRDNLGHWFINITFKKELTEREVLLMTSSGQNKTAIDPGLNPFLTKCIEMPLTKEEIQNNVSNCQVTKVYTKIVYEEVNPQKFYRNLEEKLGKAQRARRFNLSRKINNKIKNQRKDFLHKLSSNLVKENTHIIMGIVDLKRLINKKTLRGHAKSWTDNGLGTLNAMLKYKARKHNIVREEVNEKEERSTQTCSCCGKITGPKGLQGLGVSQWVCIGCGTSHNRNENSAYNHLLAWKRKGINSQRESEVVSHVS